MNKVFLLLLCTFLLIGTASALTYVDNCTDLNITGETYMLSADVYGLSPVRMNCFVISAENITFDGNGYTLFGDGAGKGVYSNQNGTIIQNFVARDNEPSIHFDGVSNGKIIFSQSTSGYVIDNPITLTGGSGNNVSYNTLSATGLFGSDIYLLSSSNNYITNNIINAVGQNAFGVMLSYSDNNYVLNNTMNSVSVNGYGIGLSNAINNSIVGNQISGMGSYAFGISLVNSSLNNIRENSIPVSLGSVGISLANSSSNYVLDSQINLTQASSKGISLITSSRNNSIEGNVISAKGTSTTFPLYLLNVLDSKVYGNNFTNFNGTTIYIQYASFTQIVNNSLYANRTGTPYQRAIRLAQSNYSMIIGNNITAEGDCMGIVLISSNTTNLTNNNILTMRNRGISLSLSSDNILMNNELLSLDLIVIVDGQLYGVEEGNRNFLVGQEMTTYNFYSALGISVSDLNYGQILFNSPLTEIGTNLSNDIQIAHNFAYVNSSKTGLNQSANITLFNAGNFTDPVIYRDGVLCPVEICSNLTINGNDYSFSVTSWSNYSIGELDYVFLSIDYPLNQTYASNVTSLNYTINSSLNDTNGTECFYSVDNWTTNGSLVCDGTFISLNSVYGLNTWLVYAFGVYENVTFYVNFPSVPLQEPSIFENVGSGFGIFLLILSQALPLLLIGLAFVGMVILIGKGIVRLVTNLSR